ncbi:MAG: PQQ-dependent sugar dehydrogenase [Pseudomonadota bacterium]
MPIQRALSLLLIVALLLSCGGGSGPVVTNPGATTGTLTININNLPATVPASVHVTGPGSYASDLSQSGSLSALVPGKYTITPGVVNGPGTSYAPTLATQSTTVAAGSTTSVSVSYSVIPLALAARVFVTGLDGPVFLTAPPGDTRQFIVERTGRIRIVQNGALLTTPFLDLRSSVSTDGEAGMLSLAFDPLYLANGYFYIYYVDLNHNIVVERRQVSADPNLAGTGAPLVLLRIAHPSYTNHFGGLATFGPDGLLYIGTGDGGGAGDPQGNAQNDASKLGKLLRVNPAQTPLQVETWAKGLRNPWRFTFDGTRLYVADVGQDLREEIDIVDGPPPGLNYGWNIMEGSSCYNTATCQHAGLVLPALDYVHGDANGCSIIGGFVYRGAAMPELAGHYFYSDYCAGFLRSFVYSGGIPTMRTDWGISGLGSIVSFGRDADGELYLLSDNGTVYKIGRAPAPKQ